jgi:hypothetical protein
MHFKNPEHVQIGEDPFFIKYCTIVDQARSRAATILAQDPACAVEQAWRMLWKCLFTSDNILPGRRYEF